MRPTILAAIQLTELYSSHEPTSVGRYLHDLVIYSVEKQKADHYVQLEPNKTKTWNVIASSINWEQSISCHSIIVLIIN